MRVIRIEDTSSTGEGVQAVAVALQVLEHLAVQRHDAGVTAIAAAIGVSKSRANSYLRTFGSVPGWSRWAGQWPKISI